LTVFENEGSLLFQIQLLYSLYTIYNQDTFYIQVNINY